MVIEKAYAKINLYLDVLGRRNDGFHNILSVMHSVDLNDLLYISCEESDNTQIVITTDSEDLPTGEDNIVYRAASKYLSGFDITANVSIRIEKKIPIGAGLGGGSSDAAATLRALNRVFKRANINQLLEIAEELGSDVPFCLLGGLCVCESKGEVLTNLPKRDDMYFVIAIGEKRISTPMAYNTLDALYCNFTKDKTTELGSEDIIKLLDSQSNNMPIYNIFEEAVSFVEIDKIKEIMIKNGADYTLMSGSGPSAFGRFGDEDAARGASDELKSNGFTSFVCKSVYPEVLYDL